MSAMPSIFARLTKVDEETRTVYGRAAQEVVDRDNEIFDYKSSKPNFMKWSQEVYSDSEGRSLGNVRAMHSNVAAGKLTDIQFVDDEQAIDIAAKIVDDGEWKKVLEGVYTGFSIGGRYARKWADSINGKMVNRYTANPSEISIVDRPCGPTSRFFTIHKADGTDVQKEFSMPAAADSGINAYDQEGADDKKKKEVEKNGDAVEACDGEASKLAKALVDALQLEKIGARNSAADAKRLQSIHDAVCELGAACKPLPAIAVSSPDMPATKFENSEISTGEFDMNDKVQKVDPAEAARRGTGVDSPAMNGPESSNAHDAENTAGAGAEKAKKAKARKDMGDDEDGDGDCADNSMKAEKLYTAEDLAKAVTTAVLSTVEKMSGGAQAQVRKSASEAAEEEAMTIPRVQKEAPSLMAVGKGGDVTKIDNVDELKKSVKPVVGGRRDKEDNGTADLIKAIHSRGPNKVLGFDELHKLESLQDF